MQMERLTDVTQVASNRPKLEPRPSFPVFLYYLIPGYLISLGLSFFVPKIYTAIAFDSGGVASGPLTSTFILPFAIGACVALGGNILSDAFGIVAMVAMTPLITIQVLGLHSKVKHKKALERAQAKLSLVKDDIIYFNHKEGDNNE